MKTGDRTGLGIWALQDHREDLDPSRRLYLAGGRVVEPDDDWRGHTFGEEGGQGTAGDIHPWGYWAPEDGSEGERGIGSWNNMVAAVSSGFDAQEEPITPHGEPAGPVITPRAGDTGPGGGGRTGRRSPSGGEKQQALPIRYATYQPDRRYAVRSEAQPSHLPLYPEGYRLVATSGTHEGAQENLLLPADGRIIVPHAHGPDRMGTIYSDLVGEGRLGEGGEYGLNERDAPGQTLHWVVRHEQYAKLQNEEGNAVALNATLTNQGEMAGFVPFIGRPLASAAEDPGDDPTRQPYSYDGGVDAHTQPYSYDAPGTQGADPGGGAAETGSLAIGLLSHEAAGPWVPGRADDVHEHGKTKDGQSVNAGHFHVDAYWIREDGVDGPKEVGFDPYPKPEKIGYPWVVEMLWDETDTHDFMDEQRPGKLRRVAWVPIIPGGPPTREPGDPTTPREPRDPTTPGSPDPREPTDPVPPGPPPFEPPTTPREPQDPGGPQGPGQGTPEPGNYPPRAGGSEPIPGVPFPGGRRTGGTRGPVSGPDSGDEGRDDSNPEGASVSVSKYDHGSYTAQPVMNLPFTMGQTSTLWRAQPLSDGAPDLRHATIDNELAAHILDNTPVVIRTEVVGTETAAGDFDYFRSPERSRIAGGESAGGVWDMPAVLDAVDYRDGAPPSSVAYPEAYRGFADGVWVGFGAPSNTQGVQDCGYRIGRDSSGNLDFDGITGGSWSNVMAMDKTNLSLANAPTSGSHAVTKDYADGIGGADPTGEYLLELRPVVGSTVGGVAELSRDVIEGGSPTEPAEPYIHVPGTPLGQAETVGIYQFIIPKGFVAASHTIKVRVRCDLVTVSNTSDGVDLTAYEQGAGSDICATSPVTFGSGTGIYETDFTLTDTSLLELETVQIYVKYQQDDDSGGGSPEIYHLATSIVIT